jgi:hypothetical protein
MAGPSSPAVSRSARRLTATAVAAVAGGLGAGGFELSRALAGNTLSWVYAVEWPLIAAYAIYIRRRLVKDLRAEDGPVAQPTWTPGTGGSRVSPEQDAPPATHRDPDLVAWREYLARLNAESPPGGPPPHGPVTR